MFSKKMFYVYCVLIFYFKLVENIFCVKKVKNLKYTFFIGKR